MAEYTDGTLLKLLHCVPTLFFCVFVRTHVNLIAYSQCFNWVNTLLIWRFGYQSLSHNSARSWVLVGDKCLYFDRLPFNRWLKLFNCRIFSRLAFAIKGCSSTTCFISSIFRLLCIALWHYVREHIIYTVYSDCVLVFAFAFLSCKKKKKKKKSALNRTFSTESYRNWQKSINILKNNGLFFKE